MVRPSHPPLGLTSGRNSPWAAVQLQHRPDSLKTIPTATVLDVRLPSPEGREDKR